MYTFLNKMTRPREKVVSSRPLNPPNPASQFFIATLLVFSGAFRQFLFETSYCTSVRVRTERAQSDVRVCACARSRVRVGHFV